MRDDYFDDLVRGLGIDPPGAATCREHPSVLEFRLADNPDDWLVMISPAGADLEHAWRCLLHRFGGRVLEVRERPES